MDNLELKIGLNSSGVKTGLAAVRAQLSDLRSHAVGLFSGAAAGFSLASLFDGAMSKAKELHDMSRRFGDTPEEIQKLGAAVRKVGGDMETAEKGGFRAFLEAQKALAGDESARKHFEDLGITLEQLSALHGPRDTLLAIADAVHNAANEHVALAAAGEIVGSRQVELIQLFRMGGDAMREAGNNAAVMGNKTVESLARAEKAIGRFKNAATVLTGNSISWLGNAGGWFKDEVGLAYRTSWQMMTQGPTAAFKNYDAFHAQRDAAKAAEDAADAEDARAVRGAAVAQEEAEANAGKLRTENEIARLKERLAQDELARARDLMSLDDKRNSLVKERAQLLSDANRSGYDSAAGLQKRIEAERALRDIQRVDKDKAQIQRRAEEDAAKVREQEAKAAEAIADKKEHLQDKAFRNAVDAMSDEEKINALTERRLKLIQEINAEKDESKRLDLASQALDVEREIGSLARKDKSPAERSRREVAAGDWTRHGGGGIAYFDRSDIDPAKQVAKAAQKTAQLTEQSKRLLERIEKNTQYSKWGP